MNIFQIPAFDTNYIWIISNDDACIVIDPGEATIVLNFLKKIKFHIKAILLTHNHYDHVNGVDTLINYFPKAVVYGSDETRSKGTHVIVSEGDDLILLNKKIKVFDLPGHTEKHIGFYYDSKLFCGDTVFSAGCGAVQTGLIQKMYQSFLKIKKLPPNTLIYSGHEYTLSNINFVATILPNDKKVINYKKKVINLRKSGKSTIPTTLELELQVNPFFQCSHADIKKSLCISSRIQEEWKVFYELRNRKNKFNHNNLNTISNHHKLFK